MFPLPARRQSAIRRIRSFRSFVSAPVVPTAYYRAVAEVDAQGNLSITSGNAYSGDNGRAAMKGGNGLYYMVGNDNSGNLSKKQLTTTPIEVRSRQRHRLGTPRARPDASCAAKRRHDWPFAVRLGQGWQRYQFPRDDHLSPHAIYQQRQHQQGH